MIGCAAARSESNPRCRRVVKLGLVTYNLARGWDLGAIVERCEAHGIGAVELRTTHAHGVEIAASPERRASVRRIFADSAIEQVSLGSVCEYHSTDPAEVEANVAETIQFIELARSIGAVGVKVRPNGFHEELGASKETTIEQIGRALRRCGQAAEDTGVSVWLEVHGRGTDHPPYIARIMESADHPNVGVCWNSNRADVLEGSARAYFDLLRPWLMSVHINNLWDETYPYRELFGLLRESGYDGYCLAEIAEESAEPDTFLRYYKALFRELTR